MLKVLFPPKILAEGNLTIAIWIQRNTPSRCLRIHQGSRACLPAARPFQTGRCGYRAELSGKQTAKSLHFEAIGGRKSDQSIKAGQVSWNQSLQSDVKQSPLDPGCRAIQHHPRSSQRHTMTTEQAKSSLSFAFKFLVTCLVCRG